MNNWNPLESQLRSWTPRTPSPKLRARLFVQPAADNVAAIETPPFSWQWFAPTLALVLITTFMLGHQGGVLGLSSSTPPGVIATAALQQPNLSTYYASVRHSENNTPVLGVEWTNGSFGASSTPTNQLLH